MSYLNGHLYWYRRFHLSTAVVHCFFRDGLSSVVPNSTTRGRTVTGGCLMTRHGNFGKADQLGSLPNGAICCLSNKRDLLWSEDLPLKALARHTLWRHLLQPWPACSKPAESGQGCSRQANTAIDGATVCVWHGLLSDWSDIWNQRAPHDHVLFGLPSQWHHL